MQGTGKTYIGITGVLDGQDDEEALQFRRQWHLKCPRKWLEGFARGSLAMAIVTTGLTEEAALMEEARHTAAKFGELGKECVRGGPWCRRALPPDDLAELRFVAGCSKTAAVMAYAEQHPRGSLAAHLSGRRYSSLRQPVPAVSLSPAAASARVPLVVLPGRRPSGRSGCPGRSGRHAAGTPRQSGKHKASTPRQSGRHKPGVARPSSGLSGSRISGAAHRLHALPFLPSRKRPAAGS